METFGRLFLERSRTGTSPPCRVRSPPFAPQRHGQILMNEADVCTPGLGPGRMQWPTSDD
jgi:hypothetical protein